MKDVQVDMKQVGKKILSAVKLIYTPLSLLCVLYYCWLNKDLILSVIELSSAAPVMGAVLLWTILHFISPLSPKIVFKQFGAPLPYGTLLSIHINQIPARYLPGGIWHTVGRMTSYHRLGVPNRKIGFFAVIEIIAPGILTLALGGLILWHTGPDTVYLTAIKFIALIMTAFILFVLPAASRFLNPAAFNKDSLKAYALFIGSSCFYWLIATTAFLLYWYAFTDPIRLDEDLNYMHIIGSYLFSWGVGYMAVFAPQGIGVFEVVAGTLMDLPLKLGSAVVFLAGFRLVSLVADCLTWLFFKLAQRYLGAAAGSSDPGVPDPRASRGDLR